MHARVTTLHIRPDKVDESVALFEQQIVPVLKAQPGFQGVRLLVNRASGDGLAISQWNSEAEGQAYEASGTYRQLVGMVAANFSAPPSLATYEVAVRA
jgi:heme-degrading monooxygenase HmoA